MYKQGKRPFDGVAPILLRSDLVIGNLECIAEGTGENVLKKPRLSTKLQTLRYLKQIGVNIIIKPEVDAGIRTALIAANDQFIKYSKSVEEIGDGYTILSTIVKNVKWTKKELRKLTFTSKGINIVSIKRKNKIFLPSAELQLETGDLLTLIGKNKALLKILDQLASEK